MMFAVLHTMFLAIAVTAVSTIRICVTLSSCELRVSEDIKSAVKMQVIIAATAVPGNRCGEALTRAVEK